MGRYLTNGSLNRIFTRVKGYVDKLKTSGQVYDSARWGGKLLSEAVMRYSYAINTKGLDKTKFYPVVFGSTPWTWDCEIHTPGAGGSAEFNQNYIHFLCNSYGWNDLFDNFKILTNGNYDDNEIVIGAIGAATQNGQMCVWVRGGIEYDIVFWSNRVPTLYKGDAVCGTTTFACGTNLDGGANVNVRILWKNDGTRDDAAYATKKEVSDGVASGIDALNLNTKFAEKADKADVTSKLNGFSNALSTTNKNIETIRKGMLTYGCIPIIIPFGELSEYTSGKTMSLLDVLSYSDMNPEYINQVLTMLDWIQGLNSIEAIDVLLPVLTQIRFVFHNGGGASERDVLIPTYFYNVEDGVIQFEEFALSNNSDGQYATSYKGIFIEMTHDTVTIYKP